MSFSRAANIFFSYRNDVVLMLVDTLHKILDCNVVRSAVLNPWFSVYLLPPLGRDWSFTVGRFLKIPMTA